MAYNTMTHVEPPMARKPGQTLGIVLSVFAAIVMLPVAFLALPFIFSSARNSRRSAN